MVFTNAGSSNQTICSGSSTLLPPSQSGVDPRNCSSLQTREIMQRKSSGSLPPENSQVRADQGQQNLAATINGRQLGIIAAIPIDLLDRAGCEQSRDRPNQTLHATRNDRNPPLADHRPGCATGSQATLRLPACCSTKSDHITAFCRHCRPWPIFFWCTRQLARWRSAPPVYECVVPPW